MIIIIPAKDFTENQVFSEEFIRAYRSLSPSSKQIVREKNKKLDIYLDGVQKKKESNSQIEEVHKQLSGFTAQLEEYLNNR